MLHQRLNLRVILICKIFYFERRIEYVWTSLTYMWRGIKTLGTYIDITGQRFGKLVVLRRVENALDKNVRFLCRCDCGSTKVIRSENLRSGNTKSCGCEGGVFIDITGQRFNRLLVLKRVTNDKKGDAQFLCRCDCGNETIVRGYCISTGHTKSCGCLHIEKVRAAITIHNESTKNIKEYRKWADMKTRCYQKGCDQYENYGGRGIIVCDRWLNSYQNFVNDMGRCPKDLTLERIDNNGNYEPNNCKWATIQEQARNKRNNRRLTFNGKTQILAEWVREWNIPRHLLRYYLEKGKTMEQIFKINKGGR
jgi:hypothetical protein